MVSEEPGWKIVILSAQTKNKGRYLIVHFSNTPCYLDSGTKKQVYFVSGMVVGPSVGS